MKKIVAIASIVAFLVALAIPVSAFADAGGCPNGGQGNGAEMSNENSAYHKNC